MTIYAIITWNTKGPIKTWSQMQSVELHNGRGTPLGHTVDGAPPPEYLYGTPRIVADARQRLIDHGVDPDKRHREGVIAREVILTASRDFFAMGTEQERIDRLREWKEAQVPFLLDHFGQHRLVSAVLHQDEYTPHIHAIVLALKYAADRRSPGSGPRWTLAGEVLSGWGMWAKDQTAYAMAMAPFGLQRGKENSGNRHKPYQEHITELEAGKKGLDIARREIASQQAAIDQALAHLAEGWTRLYEAGRVVSEKEREAESARAAATALVEEAAAAHAAADAREEQLREQFQLLRDQAAKADRREAELRNWEQLHGRVVTTGKPATPGMIPRMALPQADRTY